jgi:peptidyl-prolyl cis-trans isomerase C
MPKETRMKPTFFALAASVSLLALSSALSHAAEEKAENPAVKAEESEEVAKEPTKEAAAEEEKSDDKVEGKAAPKGPRDFVIMRVGTDEIKNSEAEELWKSLFPGGTAPDFASFDENIRQNVLRGIVSERLIYQEATKEGFDKSEEVQKRLESLKKQLIMQAYMESKAKKLITEQQLKSAYAKRTSALKNEEETRARHVLVATEDEAKAIAKDLKKGGDIEKIAKEKSLDKGSAIQGGDLGYFTKEKMVPEFAEAAFKLKKGEISDPVKTSFGWHIIKVEDRRPLRVPSFEEMREDLQGEVSNQAVQEFVQALLKKADIKYYTPDGKEQSFSRTLDKN